MQSGYMYALERGYDVAVQVDGDGQHDPRQIADLLQRLPSTRSSTWSRAPAFSREGDGYRSLGRRRPGIRIFAVVLSRIPASTSPTPPPASA